MKFPNSSSFKYTPPSSDNWSGRIVDQPGQYWYQVVSPLNILRRTPPADDGLAVGLLGYATDVGVARNLGRVGAAAGPRAIRERLGRLAWHGGNAAVYDCGDFSCTGKNLEDQQSAFSAAVTRLQSTGGFSLGLGGGHDIAFAHLRGLHRSLPGEARLGIVNLDAHFDLRPVVAKGNSGTPFRQLLELAKTDDRTVAYLALGIQASANTPELFSVADNLNEVAYRPMNQCRGNYRDSLLDQLQSFADRHDFLYLSVDLDGFSSAYAPGVSAPSPMGFDPEFGLTVIDFLAETGQLIGCDFAEMNPIYDRDNATANLAARLVDRLVKRLGKSSEN